VSENELLGLVTVGEETVFPVNGRILHEKLGIETPYSKWFPRMCEYGFEDGKDYVEVSDKNVLNPNSQGLGGRPSVNHTLTLNMAKELCMLQRTDIGRQIRRRLIEIENSWNDPEQVLSRAFVIAKSNLETARFTIANLNARIEQDAPAVNFAKTFVRGKENITVRKLAIDLTERGYDTGEKRLYVKMREEGYVVKGGRDHNLPTKRSIDAGWLTIATGQQTVNGETKTRSWTLVTPKGQEYFYRHYCGDKYCIGREKKIGALIPETGFPSLRADC
jgi:anti-repressor protein